MSGDDERGDDGPERRAPGAGVPGPSSEAPPPLPEAVAHRRPWARAVAVLAAVALVVAAVAGTLVVRGGGGADDDPSGQAPPTPVSPAELEALVEELSAVVADDRGLAFREPVEVTLLSDDAFEARVLEEAAEAEDEVRLTQRLLAALGLVEPDVDLVAAQRRLQASSALGFYDPRTDELVVRGTEAGPLVRVVLVHELVHALDDQHFDLHRPALLDVDDERGVALQALIEGSAVRVEQAYRGRLSAAERRAVARDEAALVGDVDLDDVPEVLLAFQQFPYLAGVELVRAVVEAGGTGRLDDAFVDPPATSEHVLHPESFLAGEDAVPVAAPPPDDGEVLDEGVVGEWALLLLLADQLPVGEARAAAEGWGGDRYVAWVDGDRTCVRLTLAADAPADLVELVDALERWADGRERAPGATATVVEEDDRATVTSCG